MTVLAIPTYFHNWLQEKSGDGSIQVFDDGRATINASAGSVAYLYTAAQLFPGETVEFSCNAYAATGKAQISIQAFTSGSGQGDVNEIDAFTGGKNNKAVSVKWTAPFSSDTCSLVYFRIGVATADSGSITVMCPRAQISRGFIGVTRTNAAALLEVHNGAVSINTSYLQTGIQEVNFTDSGDGTNFDIEVVMDKIVATAGSAKGINPLLTVDKQVSSGATTNKLNVGISSYNALSRRAYIRFTDPSTGLIVNAKTVLQCNLVFKSEII